MKQSNTSIGRARKGSKFQMQRIVLPENKKVFDDFIQDELNWFSPLMENNFVEYRMNSPILLNKLGITQKVKQEFLDSLFWPSPQPQWDGIAFGRNNTLYLFEAKSHISEIQPGIEGNKDNDRIKYDSIMRCSNLLFGIEDIPSNRDRWCRQFYQISNRITFANKLKEIKANGYGTYERVKLILLNFINDRTWEKDNLMVKDSLSWNTHYKKILVKLGIDENQCADNDIYIKNFDLNLLIQKNKV
jgi:hypothetical protein